MSTFNYANLVATTLAMLTKFGDVGNVGDSATLRQVLMVRMKVQDHTLLDSKVTVGDFIYILSPQVYGTTTDSAPKEGERMLFDGESTQIVNVQVMKPDATTLYYKVWVRLG